VPFRWPARQAGFVSIAGLRGAVPIVFAAIPLGLGLPGAETVFDATLIVVLVLTLIQAPTLPWVARRLGVTEPEQPMELNVDVAPLDDLDAAVIAIDIDSESRLIGVYVRELPLPSGAVVSLIVRGDHVEPAGPAVRLREGDRLIVVAAEAMRTRTEEVLRELSRKGRLGNWHP